MSRSIARLVVTAACGAVLASAVVPAAVAAEQSVAARPTVAFGKIQYDSPGRDDRSNRSLNVEWVTVTNTGKKAVDLSRWTLTDNERHTYRFGTLRLAAHASVRVHTGTGRDSAADVYQNRRAYVWNNDRDKATLRDAAGRTVATASWGRR
ncbi:MULTISPECIES: lamin tail domain-containing protein [Streptomyces]|uniref:lamin tail domain-containing protein n=1 Tax=Streptomyces TaxID=1883 RepID=UPI00163CF565|nr:MULTISPECIES: lamin tail domain-containing protein [Streptomyces]MBC2873514.1 lamin tail domain-containing protein [Streptomyces sp. TYQ1024]UBI36816.1 lamin tail domain-containing protein [Streptomyces mobaraensis]UKW29408.1 lamin tail domain-containing protein [Streptomyces sp. TYQ1024]